MNPFSDSLGWRRCFRSSRGLIFGSAAEQRLLNRTHPVAHLPSLVLGWGIETPMDSDAPIAQELDRLIGLMQFALDESSTPKAHWRLSILAHLQSSFTRRSSTRSIGRAERRYGERR